MTPLHFAAENGHLSVVEYLVNQKADISAKGKYDLTPLHFAAENGHLSVVEYLVNQKADINVKTNDDWTPLYYSYRYGDLSVVENPYCYYHYSYNFGVFSEKNGKTPLGLAIQCGKSNVVEFLKSKGGQ